MIDQDRDFTLDRAKHLLEKTDAEPSMYIADISRMFECIVSASTEKLSAEAGFSGHGLSRGYRHILFQLSKEDGVTQLSLVQRTKLKAPTVSVALAKMEEHGLVRREADEKDLRQVRVYITEKGRELDRQIRQKCRETDKIMMAGISESETEQLKATLKKILENMLGEGNDI